MNQYAAIVGHQPHISVAELVATFPNCSVQGIVQKNVVLFETSAELSADVIDLLGGCILIARAISVNKLSTDDVPKILANELEKAKRGKLTFSLRAFGVPKKTIKDLYRLCKDKLKSTGRSSRYVGNERKAVPAVVLHDNDMLTGKLGCELTIVADEDLLWIGRTIAAQDVNAYTKRDIDKPVRDTKAGLLPPKLAQIILNLGHWAATKDKKAKEKKKFGLKNLTVFDPFCGTGVVPMECLLRSWGVIASDLSQKAVNDCTKNCDWTRKEYGIAKKDVPAAISKHDARKAFDLKKQSPDVIVTETMLGPNLTKRPTLKDIKSMRSENEKLQEAFLRNCKECLGDVPIVCTWPVWYASKEQFGLEKIWDQLPDIGYQAVVPYEQEGGNSERPSLVYRRPDQFVGREIVLLQPM